MVQLADCICVKKVELAIRRLSVTLCFSRGNYSALINCGYRFLSIYLAGVFATGKSTETSNQIYAAYLATVGGTVANEPAAGGRGAMSGERRGEARNPACHAPRNR